MSRGLIHIYCGDGKGKTTAATGLAVRAAGSGMKVLIARFMKKAASSELDALKLIPGIEVIPIEKEFRYVKVKNENVSEEAIEYLNEYFDRAVEKAMSGEYDLFVMDEIIGATRRDLIHVGKLIDFLDKRPENLEVVMTGRGPLDVLVEKADYVSEVRKIKHPIDQGIYARKGIEF
ncbi:MAG: cob(I)yrinic acid a,c-diamide adenosyltransferase [Erysipelotrichaceae bacterium]|nr:cob(I)yrinic acid a,c-diamide adenosyltransferase [Erysipelotrichaceae bacterium]